MQADFQVKDLITVSCRKSVSETVDGLAKLIEANGLRVFSRIDHAANAAGIGMSLRPTELLIFGNPKGGTPLMQDKQTIGLDLPFKALVWEDENSRVWLTYADPEFLAKRHDLGPSSTPVIEAIKSGVAKLAHAAAQ
jgi:uncharacterized protein (DUF302 family)